MRSRLLDRLLIAIGLLSIGALAPVAAVAQDYNRPPDSKLEMACASTARVDLCVAYHKISCEVRGLQRACQFYALGMNCNGGDQQKCAYYVSLLNANRACMQNDQAGCAYLRQQGLN